MNDTKSEGWEERFDEKWTDNDDGEIIGFDNKEPILSVDCEDLKTFIRAEISIAREEGYLKGYGVAANAFALDKEYEKGRSDALQQALEAVPIKLTGGALIGSEEYDEAWNACRAAMLSNLSTLTQENKSKQI